MGDTLVPFDHNYRILLKVGGTCGSDFDFDFEEPTSASVRLFRVCDPELSLEEIRSKYAFFLDPYYEVIEDDSITFALLWYDSGSWHAFDVDTLPKPVTLSALREATGVTDL